MIKKNNLICIISITILCLCVISGIVYLITHNIKFPPKCKIDEFQNLRTFLPEGSFSENASIPMYDTIKDSIFVSYVQDGEELFFILSRRWDEDAAHKEFEKKVSGALDDMSEDWNQPFDLTLSPSSYDEYEFGCGVDLHYYQCRFVGRYHDYVFYVRSHISEKAISHDEFVAFIENSNDFVSVCAMP